ncbi:MAG: serine protease [Pseudomonadota bacterium]
MDDAFARAKRFTARHKAIFKHDHRLDVGQLSTLVKGSDNGRLPEAIAAVNRDLQVGDGELATTDARTLVRENDTLRELFSATGLLLNTTCPKNSSRPCLKKSGNKWSMSTFPYQRDYKDSHNEGRFNVCKSERFSDQEIAADGSCTGFVFSKANIFVTAGHCLRKCSSRKAITDEALRNFRVVFGFAKDNGSVRRQFTSDQVFKVKLIDIGECEKRTLTGIRGKVRVNDYAILELDRANILATPLSADPRVVKGKKLGVAGYPAGLPLKFSYIEGQDRKNEVNRVLIPNSVFSAKIDTFEGNSGSPVVSFRDPLKVVGMLVAGNGDYFFSPGPPKCLNYQAFGLDGIQRGEEVIDIKVVTAALKAKGGD